jgi:hypothetical protein
MKAADKRSGRRRGKAEASARGKGRGRRGRQRGKRRARAPGLNQLFTCPDCGYVSCLLGLAAHSIARHQKNLIAWACRAAPPHLHPRRRATKLKFATIRPTGAPAGEREPPSTE